jgi:hypothetical protein
MEGRVGGVTLGGGGVKVSELIQHLQDFQNEHGDVDTIIEGCDCWGRPVKVIEVDGGALIVRDDSPHYT